MTVSIRAMTVGDWAAVAAIYGEGIAGGGATFETEVPAYDAWDRGHLAEGRIVAEDESGVVGWAALSPTSDRCVYGGVAEVSVYIADRAQGRGVGTALLRALVEQSEDAGLWTLQAGIFPDNAASLRLHESAGFRVVGTRERLGKHAFDTWRDVVLMERRSPRF